MTAGYRVEWGEESSGTSCVHTLMEASLNSEVKYVHQHTHLNITIVYIVDDIQNLMKFTIIPYTNNQLDDHIP